MDQTKQTGVGKIMYTYQDMKSALRWWVKLSDEHKNSIKKKENIKIIQDIVCYWVDNVKFCK